MKYIVVIDYYDSLQFFERLLKSVSNENIYVITNLISVYYKVSSYGMNATLINRFSKENRQVEIDCTKARELAALEVSKDAAKSYVSKIYNALVDSLNGTSNYQVLCWNGSDLKGAAIRSFVSNHEDRVSSKYFEITNFSGYFFSDSKGVNAQSTAFLNPDSFKLVKINDQKELLVKIKEELIESKRTGSLPQVELSKKITVRHVMDALYQAIFGCSNFSFKPMLKRFTNKVRSKRNGEVYFGKYLKELTNLHAFMPLQVASDSQLLINYHGNILDSVKEANEIAKKAGKTLVVKFHPAETDHNILLKVVSYCDSENIEITNIPVPEAVYLSGLVITVNSTSGFEAQLEGKEVIYLGASQYSNISSEIELLKYINKYFNKGDFFSHEDISSEYY
jgi:capsular polysaccharide export protein